VLEISVPPERQDVLDALAERRHHDVGMSLRAGEVAEAAG
jgi:hypothetical protein